VALIVVAAGCGLGKANFKDSAEEVIEDDDRMAENFAGQTFDDAVCEEPPNDDVDTEFTCTATDATGAPATFVVRITSEDEFLVTAPQMSPAAPTTAPSTAPAAPTESTVPTTS
jgi:hypothetical protein